jgi:hypothetical protein
MSNIKIYTAEEIAEYERTHSIHSRVLEAQKRTEKENRQRETRRIARELQEEKL